MNEKITLDGSQKEVAYLPASARAIVIAGAGQGKTELVSARLEYLVAAEGLNPFDEILVLSFSRAAVHAVKERMRDSGSASHVSIRTLDSFASLLLFEAERDPAGRSFDQRIRDAIEVLAETHESETIEMLRHVIIDEIQDIVSERSLLICAILGLLQPEAGFTVLGDPLQSIYDFQLENSSNGSGNEVLLALLEKRLRASTYRLTGNYRARSEDARAAVMLGETMRSTEDSASRLREAKNFLSRCGTLGDVSKMSAVIRSRKGTSAILCYTNGQALLVSRALAKQGVSHRLRRPAQEPSIPAWVALALANSPQDTLDQKAAGELISAAPGAPDPEEAWRMLKSAEGNRRARDYLDLGLLSTRLLSGAIPVALAEDGSATIIVSTIHRAKGLEFDNVVILEQSDEITDPLEQRQRASVLFVALTRARNHINTFTLDTKGLSVSERPPHLPRWQVRKPPRKIPTDFELVSSDINRDDSHLHSKEATAERLCEIASTIEPGTEATAVIDLRNKIAENSRYRIERNGILLGTIGPTFADALRARIGRSAQLPIRLDGVVIDGVETRTGAPTDSRGRFWLAIRAGGLLGLEPPNRTTQGVTK